MKCGYYVGIDLGSTATKVVIMRDNKIWEKFLLPTGWNCLDTSLKIQERLAGLSLSTEFRKIVATGYGRVSVPFADKVFSEIKCHGLGGKYIFGNGNATIIDIGGQDTKVITLQDGKVTDFLMNDKCSAGTGKFLEIMANRLGVGIDEFGRLGENGKPVTISSMCTVFAESEVISYIGGGTPREDIAAGIIHSITEKVSTLCKKHGIVGQCFLTGGLCELKAIKKSLSEELGLEVLSKPEARFAGAIGAAICAQEL